MMHPKFGNKFTCWSCAAKFYDMQKADPKCPKCGNSPKDDPATKSADKSKKGSKDEPEGEEFEEESFDNDMDQLASDEDEAAEDDDVEEISGGADGE